MHKVQLGEKYQMNTYLNRLPLAVAQTLAIHKIQLHHKLLA